MADYATNEAASTGAPKVALITGITGQDGSYLAELLLEKGYDVHGLVRRNASREGVNCKNIDEIVGRIKLHKGDVTDSYYLTNLLGKVRPHEIYHLAAQSHVSQSFESPGYTMQVNAIGTLNLLQAIVTQGLQKHTKLYNAATSEIFGGTVSYGIRLNEQSPFCPKSPYAISKVSAYWFTRSYRESYGIWAVNGILFNHESPRRGSGFVTMRIARGVASYCLGINKDKPMTLAGFDMARDWGHAVDYVGGMWAMVQQQIPTDMVLATGVQHTIKELVQAAFSHVGVRVVWQYDKGGQITGACSSTSGDLLVKIDHSLLRAAEVPCLLGDSTLARKTIGWEPTITFETLVGEMVDSEMSRLKAKMER
ncbi:putative GDP-mannose 4,6 dehydratase [Cladorrhinum sp. PSN259]|nr:putative GDP-mannose 4,6 dehydratase [Cladorrhinum sp. PSN259]